MNITDNDIQKFVVASRSVRNLNNNLQEKMVEIVQGEGMDVERFNEIQVAAQKQDENIQPSEQEMKQIEQAIGKIQTVQVTVQTEMMNAIKDEGFTEESYNAIVQELQSDQELLERIQKADAEA